MQLDRRNAWYVGDLGPIPLYVHWSFLFLLLMAFRWSLPGAGFDIGLVLVYLTVLLSGVVLHEMGHGLTAKALGASGVTITLWAFGGLCSSTRDRLPRREILILAAGPAVSFALATASLVALKLLAQQHPLLIVANENYAEMLPDLVGNTRKLVGIAFAEGTMLGKFLALAFRVNLVVGIFNIMPIYPLDGGQIAYNAASLFLPARQAAKAALTVAVIAAGAYFLYDAQGQSDTNIYLIGLLGYLLYNAFLSLRA